MKKRILLREDAVIDMMQENTEFNFVSNEDSMKAWIDKGDLLSPVGYDIYLKFVTTRKIICFRSDIDNCIFWHKLNTENWKSNAVCDFMPEKPGLYDVMTENGTIGKAFCSHTSKGDMVWVSPVNIYVWR